MNEVYPTKHTMEPKLKTIPERERDDYVEIELEEIAPDPDQLNVIPLR